MPLGPVPLFPARMMNRIAGDDTLCDSRDGVLAELDDLCQRKSMNSSVPGCPRL